MKKTFRVTFKHSIVGYFRAVNGNSTRDKIAWEECPTISDCAISRFLQKNMPDVKEVKSAKVTIEFD